MVASEVAVALAASEVMEPTAEVTESAAPWTALLIDCIRLLTDAATSSGSGTEAVCALAERARTPTVRAEVKRILASVVVSGLGVDGVVLYNRVDYSEVLMVKRVRQRELQDY